MRDFSRDHSALALNTASLGHNLDGAGAGWEPERVIDACAARGYGGIVFWRREIGKHAARIGHQARASGLKVAGLCRTPYLVGRQAGGNEADLQSSLDMAAELGAEVLTIVTGGTEPGSKGVIETQNRLAERVASLVPLAEAAGVSLALEPLNPMFGGNRTCLFTVADALSVVEQVASPHVGIAVDVYHVWWDRQLATDLRAAHGKVFGYHLCDWLEDTQHMLLDRGMMGDGVADLRAIRQAVEDEAGYEGLCEVEVFSAENWWKRDPADVLDVIVDRFRRCC